MGKNNLSLFQSRELYETVAFYRLSIANSVLKISSTQNGVCAQDLAFFYKKWLILTIYQQFSPYFSSLSGLFLLIMIDTNEIDTKNQRLYYFIRLK